MDTTWVITAVLGLIVFYLFYYKYSKKGYWETRGVPQIESSIFQLLKMSFLSNKTFVDYSLELYKKYIGERYIGYSMGTNKTLLVHDLELIQHILIKDFSHFEDRSMPMVDDAELINLGLASVNGKRWRVLRHKMTPTFSSGKLKFMFSLIKESCDEFIFYLKDKKNVDLETRDFLFKFMINVIASTTFSAKADAFNEDEHNRSEFLEMSRLFFRPSLKFRLKLIILSILPALQRWLKFRVIETKVNDFFINYTKSLIEHRMQSGQKRNDFLQLMLDQRDKELAVVENTQNLADENESVNSEKELYDYLQGINYDKSSFVFTDESIAAQIFTFISGGTETITTALSFALYELARNTDVQKKLQAEIDSVLSTQEFNYEAVKKMKYLEQVLNETLRQRPPAGFISRLCVQDFKVPGSDLIIEKGCFVQIPVLSIHQDAQYFEEPEKFNPDRFEDMDSIPKGAFLPFGGGPRICIAMRLAILKMKVFLATVLASYNVVHSEKTQLPLIMDKTSMLYHVKGGLWVKFEARQ